MLEILGAVPEQARVVRDGDLITGGGVTSGIDFALTLAAELYGADVARSVQLAMEYEPEPPFDAGSPGSKDVDSSRVEAWMAAARSSREPIVRRAAARLGP